MEFYKHNPSSKCRFYLEAKLKFILHLQNLDFFFLDLSKVPPSQVKFSQDSFIQSEHCGCKAST